MKKTLIAMITVAFLAAQGCTMTSTASSYNGLKDFDGNEVTHYNTTNVALHVLFKDPLWGDASFDKTMSDMTSAAKADGHENVRVVQSSKSTLWYLFFPLTLVINPVVSNVAADAHK